MPRPPTGDELENTGVGDALEDTGVGDDLEAPPARAAVASERVRAWPSAGGRIAMRGHPRAVTSTTTFALVGQAEHVRLEVVIGGARPQRGSRELPRKDYAALFERLRAATSSPPGGALVGDQVGSIELELALGDLALSAQVDGQQVARLAAIADILLQEVALTHVALSPDLHPIDPTDRTSVAALDGDDDDEDTQVY